MDAITPAHPHRPPAEPDRHCDVAIIGGGAAGLAAALQLARSRRSVVVVDAGEPRNGPAAHMHAYLGHDGRPPTEFLALGRQEARGYGAEILDGAATALARDPDGDGFLVALADGRAVAARRVLVATGLVDELPAIPGVAEQWGRGVVHCPYCHGWEVRDQALVVIATSPLATHQALLFRQLSPRVTVVVHPPDLDLGDDVRRRLAARGIPVEDGPVDEVVVGDGVVRAVGLAGGRRIEAEAVVVAPRFVARAELLRGVGLTPAPAPMGVGEAIEADASGATAVAGLYVAGNVADVSHQVLQAAAAGSRVAAVINADLVEEDTARAVAAGVDDPPRAGPRRFGPPARER